MQSRFIATILLLVPIIAHSACRPPLYIGKLAADEVTRRNYENCMKQAKPNEQTRTQQDLIDKQRLQMQEIERQQTPQLR